MTERKLDLGRERHSRARDIQILAGGIAFGMSLVIASEGMNSAFTIAAGVVGLTIAVQALRH